MVGTTEDVERLVDSGVVAVMRGADAETVIDVAQALHDGGVTALELTADSDDVTGLVREVTASFGDEVIVGTGTVLDAETARACMMAGSEFVVAPTLDTETIDICNSYGVPVAPGVFTPTEALRGYEAGADLVKVFPASSVGPGHLSSIKGPLGQIPIMPTGGVGLDNAGDFIEAGAECVGVGSSLIDGEAIEAGDFHVLTEKAEQFVEVVENARGE